MIYYAQSGTNGPIKIGTTSKDVEGRLRNLQIGNPEKLKLLAVTDGGEQEEAALHQKFSDYALRGEWFSPSETLLHHIATECGGRYMGITAAGMSMALDKMIAGAKLDYVKVTEIFSKQPRLMSLVDYVLHLDHGKNFCANLIWYPKIQKQIRDLVGWYAINGDAKSQEDYETTVSLLWYMMPACTHKEDTLACMVFYG